MKLAFCLFKYFPYGGLQRDFLRIALACQARGHSIRVYTLEWQGEVPPGFEVQFVPVRAWQNHNRCRRFAEWVMADLARQPVDRVVGFNKMPGLDVYFAADTCFEEKARTRRGWLYRLSSRYRGFAALEWAVFAPSSYTQILTISRAQQPSFERYYGTPPERFHHLPPGISANCRAPADAPVIRAAFRAEFELKDDTLLLLHLGSGFKRKGLDRCLKAMAALPEALRKRTRLFVVGKDRPRPFQRLAHSLALSSQVVFLGGRDDVPRFLLGADLLIHPAYEESAGIVLLEALVAGLPVLVTDVCGYAHYIEEAGAGCLIASPFTQKALDETLAGMLADPEVRARWSRNALAFSEHADIYSLHERAVDFILNTRSDVDTERI
ncbi:MAG: glycosyltransferase family 4 protein [Azoarcus sp.]|nr:glycosyltransferase family 4 protein [Azoarcus sp.]